MKTLKIIKYLFTIVGAGLLIGVIFIYISTHKFLETAITTQGTVIELLPSRSNSSSGNSITYTPLVQFIDKKGNQIKFSSSNSSNPPSYNVDEKIEILYNPESPKDAKINSFMSIWGGVTILGILGVIFSSIGVIFFIYDKRKSNLIEFLHQNGTKIDSVFQSVEINSSFAVNGKNPFQIISQWQNPATSKLHIFTSDNIWFDPTHFIKSDKITVIIDRNNPKKYLVDLSFLPDVVN